MITIENGCVGCPEGMGCLGKSCPKLREVCLTCDVCGEMIEAAYIIDDKHVCAECLTDYFPYKDIDEIAEEVSENGTD